MKLTCVAIILSITCSFCVCSEKDKLLHDQQKNPIELKVPESENFAQKRALNYLKILQKSSKNTLSLISSQLIA